MTTLGKRVVLGLAIVWSGLALLLLAIGMEPGEARRTAMILLALLGSPSAFLIGRYLPSIAPELGAFLFVDGGSMSGYFAGWFFIFFVGFFQWFLLPRIVISICKKMINKKG